VLVEKPVALTADEVQRMLDARPAGAVAACCSSRFRSTETAARATEMVASGELGPVRRLTCTALGAPPKKLDGTGPLYLYKPNWGGLGTLGEWGCYDLDFLLGICGWSLEPKRVLADVRYLPDVYAKKHPPLNEAEVQVSAKVTFEGGAVLDYRRANYFAGEPRDEWAIECEGGTLALSMIPKAPQLTIHRYGDEGIESSVEVEGPEAWGTILGGPVLDFAGAILDDRPPRTDVEQALTVQRITDEIYASAKCANATEC